MHYVKYFGESRYTSGNLGTDYQFTGQRNQAELGIYWFSSRWFDPTLGRFMQPDTIVPTSTQGTQAWDRLAFVNNNPVRYNDPTGHYAEDVHFELTYQVVQSNSYNILIDRGYTPSEAQRISENIAEQVASADRGVDVGQEMEIPADPSTRHWRTTQQAGTEIEGASTLEEFGKGLHSLQDSFSHDLKLGGATPEDNVLLHFSNNFAPPADHVDNYDPLHNFLDLFMYVTLVGVVNGYMDGFIPETTPQRIEPEKSQPAEAE